MKTYGIIEIDNEGTWFVPEDLEECSTFELLDAIRSTFIHAPDSGPSSRNIRTDLRNHLADVLIERGDMRVVEDEDERGEDEVSFTLNPFGGSVGIAKMPEGWLEAEAH